MRYHLLSIAAALAALFLLCPVGSTPAVSPDVPAELPKGLQIETRGPIHEGFAQPYDLTPEPGPLVPKAPPPNLNEEPPDLRPPGDNIQFLPGYWAWDAERNEYLWVSGVLRDAPAGQQFTPGYWQQTNEGYRWVRGYWGPGDQQPSYVPEPPATREVGPSLPAPDDNSFYVPGTWIYQDVSWLWRPGYWARIRPNRVWIAAHYQWTPAGFIFLDGYWDCPLEDRGLLFAPVCFTAPLWNDPGWCYRPSFVINLGGLFDCLWARHGGYYFGDYFGPAYARAGYRPWYGAHYDPLYGYERWHNRGNPNWAGGLSQSYAARGAGRLAAPPRTYTAATTRGPALATPLNQFARTTRLATVNASQRTVQNDAARRVRDAAKTRSQNEAKLATSGPASARRVGSAGTATNLQGNANHNAPRFVDSGKSASTNQGKVTAGTPAPRVYSGGTPQGNTAQTSPRVNSSSPQAKTGKAAETSPRVYSSNPPQGKTTQTAPRVNSSPPQAKAAEASPRVYSSPPQTKTTQTAPRVNSSPPHTKTIQPAPPFRSSSGSIQSAPKINAAPTFQPRTNSNPQRFTSSAP